MSKLFHLIFISIAAFAFSCASPEQAEEHNEINPVDTIVHSKLEFGLYTDSFKIIHGTIKRNEFLSDILLDQDVPYPVIHELSEKSKSVYDVRKLGRSKNYLIYFSKDTTERAMYFIYLANDIDYVVYDFSSDSIEVRMGQKPVLLVEKRKTGIIKRSLYETLQDSNQNVLLAFEMADIFAWTIDFYRLQPGDSYNILYAEKQVEGKSIGIENVSAVIFNHEGVEFRAYYYEQDSTGVDFFDEEGESLRKAFLKSPLKFSRLSSGYSGRRFHPVQKRWKAHLGTDYAAPRGTPIKSTGDGVVVEAKYKRFNGNYVKIRHNSVYMTQYLHMNKIGKGIKPGTYVKQGDIIGYVGSTGLATGPHVCYRFWKNGSQVNHLKEDFPPSEPILEKNREEFKQHMMLLDAKLISRLPL